MDLILELGLYRVSLKPMIKAALILLGCLLAGFQDFSLLGFYGLYYLDSKSLTCMRGSEVSQVELLSAKSSYCREYTKLGLDSGFAIFTS